MWIKNNFENARANFINSGTISEKDKDCIELLINKLLATKIKYNRAEKYYIYYRLMVCRGWISTYQGLRDVDIYRCLSEIEHNTNLGPEARRDYKICLKRILEHLDNPLSKIIKTTTPPKYLPRNFLTVHDMLKVSVCKCKYLRDKAMCLCLYESNCRPHEFFMLRRSDIVFESLPGKINNNGNSSNIKIEVAYLNINQDSKTGARRVPIIFTVPWLKAWLRESEGEYLWIDVRGAGKGEQIKYHTARKAMKQTLKEAGIKDSEKMSLYAFRHGRNTEVSHNLSYSEHCEYAGWQQGSEMPRVYIHLSGYNTLKPLLAPFGITVDSTQTENSAWMDIMAHGLELFNQKTLAEF